MATYPSSLVSFTTKTNKVDLVDASHINTLQEEVVAIETELGTLIKGSTANLKARLAVMLANDGALVFSAGFPSSPVAHQLFYRSDSDTVHVRNNANSAWIALGGSLSNVIFQYCGNTNQQGVANGEYTGTSLSPNGSTGNYRFIQIENVSYQQVLKGRFIKIAGINTVTIVAEIWNRVAGTASLRADIGGQNNSVSTTSTTPTWATTSTIDVSSLTNGVTYDIAISMNGSAGEEVYCSNIFLISS